MNQREYKRLRAAVEKEYLAKIQALDMVYQMSRGASPVTSTGKKSPPDIAPNAESAATALLPFSPQSSPPSTGLADAVREVVKQIEGDFTLSDLDGRVRKLLPEARTPSISNVLIRLIKKQQVHVVTQRMGKKPAIYRRA